MGIQVVAYDDAGGALAAGRAWWLLRWSGHEEVTVLDGGWQGWLYENYPVNADVPDRTVCEFIPRQRSDLLVDTSQVAADRLNPIYRSLRVLVTGSLQVFT